MLPNVPVLTCRWALLAQSGGTAVRFLRYFQFKQRRQINGTRRTVYKIPDHEQGATGLRRRRSRT